MAKQFAVFYGRAFRTKGEARKFFSVLLQTGPLETPISDESEHQMLLSLLGHHPEREEKFGAGVAHFFRRINRHPVKETRGFWVKRVDGTEEDFSYPKCLDGVSYRGDRVKKDFAMACRRAITPSIAAFRESYFDLFGEDPNFSDSHIDHAPPWPLKRIVEEFAQIVGYGVKMHDYTSVDWGFPPDVEKQFRDFHDARAKLRVISAKENLQGGAWGA
jgi:Protein of unknown function (DUF3223)